MQLEHLDKLNKEIEKGWLEMEMNKGRNSIIVFNDLRKRYTY